MNKQKLIELRCKAWGITEDEYYCNQCSDFSLEDMARAYRRGKNKGARDKAIQNVGFYQKQMQDIYDKKNKQIAELETRCNELFLQTCEQAEKIKELEEDNNALQTAYNILKDNDEKIIKEMGEQIEKMKCCGNCKNEGDYKEPYRYGTGWCNICKRHKVAKGNFDKWEIKEND
jgi:septal ring factor EnvC (AmiA/AmiB activator)